MSNKYVKDLLKVVGTPMAHRQSKSSSSVHPPHQQTQSAQGPKDQDACNSVDRNVLEVVSLQYMRNHILIFLGIKMVLHK